MKKIRFGVFNLGQIWTVVAENGLKIGFPSRDLAVSAAVEMAGAQHAPGSSVEVMIQDELGRLRHLTPSEGVETPSSSA